MANFKAAGCNRFFQFVFRFACESMSGARLVRCDRERAHLILFSSNLKFHASIPQITDPPGYIKAFGRVTHGPAKPDALNISLIENLQRRHRPAVKLLMLLADARRSAHEHATSVICTINEAKGALFAFNQIDRDKVLNHCSTAQNRLQLFLRCRSCPS